MFINVTACKCLELILQVEYQDYVPYQAYKTLRLIIAQVFLLSICCHVSTTRDQTLQSVLRVPTRGVARISVWGGINFQHYKVLTFKE